ARRLGLIHDEEPPAPPPRLAMGPLPDDAPVPTSAGLAAALSKPTSAPALGSLTGVVLNPATGQSLWSRNPDRAMVPGSTGKLLTAAAVLLTKEPTARLSTRVVAGATPDSVVLVGGGDPTLSVLPAPGGAGDDAATRKASPTTDTATESVYAGAAKLDTLAAEVRAAHPGPIRSVAVDVSLFTGPGLAPGWDPADIVGGQMTSIEPLILDGGRSKPDELDPPRTATPAVDAGKALAKRLGADQATVQVHTASPGAAVLGEVRSPTIADLVENALRISDNVLAESLARQVALTRGAEPSFAGAARAVRETLSDAGFDVDGARMVDGSGLSTADQVPARLLGQIMAAASGPASDPRSARLRPLLAGLPVAGGDGTLDDRFDNGDAVAGRGFVRAKTGTLTGVSTLAGVVTDHDGRLLTFALMSNGTSPAESRPRLDAIAAALRTCGCR
ncbi:MAG: D-alanyl-D-alanine carboxypeptidase/D-alanyl-D-alanine-endopeptidase, partial [Pseudonocardia sp.]|nr:D-alanyl-D-alanine carboxypeptidase/D-alanyl-D-alanine-endopeptidase [Pseudonocardia sp.]